MEGIEELKLRVRQNFNPALELSDDEVLAQIDQVLQQESRKRLWSVRERAECRRQIFYSFRRLDVLQELIEDESVTEIMVNGPQVIFVERGGRLFRWERHFESAAKLMDVISQMVSRVNRVVNTSSPIVDARLPDGSRVHVVLPPVAPDGPIVTIRKFSREATTMERLVSWGSIDEEAAAFLQNAVRAGYNLFVSGGTGSGKTTFLNALSCAIPGDDRVITIEDSLELQLPLEHLVRLEVRNANAEGEREVSVRDLIRAALRMRPTRLIVGEVRGPEALDMLQAMNTGHDGSLSTGHANSPRDMLARLETMVLMGGELPLAAVRGQIAAALDLIVHLKRQRDGRRLVDSIVEVLDYENGYISCQSLYQREVSGAEAPALVAVGRLRNQRKWRDAGLPELPPLREGVGSDRPPELSDLDPV